MTLDQARDLLTRALLVISPLHQIHGEIHQALHGPHPTPETTADPPPPERNADYLIDNRMKS